MKYSYLLADDAISLSYFGVTDDSITDKLIGISEQHASSVKSSKRISFIIAECFQNVIRHSINNKINDVNSTDFFHIKITPKSTIVCSKNNIKSSQEKELLKLINRINSLSDLEMKELRRYLLNESDFSDKGGAGLGVLEMARKSGAPLHTKFVRYNENYSYFVIAIEIKHKPDLIDTVDINTIYEELYEKENDNVLLHYLGAYSNSTSSYLISMLDENLRKEESLETEVLSTISTVIEVLQNAAKHGEKYNNIRKVEIIAFHKGKSWFLTCRNVVTTKQANQLKKDITYLNKLNLEELKIEYKNRIKLESKNADLSNGLGIIDILLFTKNQLEYTLDEINSEFKLYSTTIQIK